LSLTHKKKMEPNGTPDRPSFLTPEEPPSRNYPTDQSCYDGWNLQYSLPSSFQYHTTKELKKIRNWLQDELNIYFYEDKYGGGVKNEDGVKKQNPDEPLTQGFLHFLEWFHDEGEHIGPECAAYYEDPEEEKIARRAQDLMWGNESFWELEEVEEEEKEEEEEGGEEDE